MSAPSLSNYPPSYLAQYTGNQVIAVAITFGVLECFFVALRFLARRINKSSPGWDDFLIIPSLVANLSQCSLSIVMIRIAGVGYHLPAVLRADPEKVILWAKCLVAMEWIYGLAVVLPKLAILGFYLRIFVTKPYRRTTHLLIGAVVCTFLATGLTAMFQCIPLSYIWDKTNPNGRCFNVLAFYRWISLPNILTDTSMLILPIPMVWKLNASSNKKVGLTIGFLTGSIGLISSCARFTRFFQVDAFGDPTWASVPLIIWTIIEPGIYLIAACLPALRPLLIYVLPSAASRPSGGMLAGENGIRAGNAPPLGLRHLSRHISNGPSKSGFARLDINPTLEHADGTCEAASYGGEPAGRIEVRSDFYVSSKPVGL